ncbi:acyl-CoA thioesterase [Alteribacillus bidgolensis]|uniref:Acyl-CoA thioester hydrolase n=1 Tax=Alteribacillus bidgolensis TaxID=930129 RepID=A0A1G8G434_9BACI|nr:thioesterase family protein [Alteribacillus bidgolensis]SDH89125.1 acyl-CoA thioester hydrolase [Alteribacillus bidgolensis]
MVHKWKVKVRACETDGLGHVSNISYFIYLEEARIELFRELDTMMEMDKWPFILASTSCDFVQQAYFDERLTIFTTVSRIGNKSFEIDHEISSSRGVIARGKAVVVHFNFETQKSESIPHGIRQKLSAFESNKMIKEGNA